MIVYDVRRPGFRVLATRSLGGSNVECPFPTFRLRWAPGHGWHAEPIASLHRLTPDQWEDVLSAATVSAPDLDALERYLHDTYGTVGIDVLADNSGAWYVALVTVNDLAVWPGCLLADSYDLVVESTDADGDWVELDRLDHIFGRGYVKEIGMDLLLANSIDQDHTWLQSHYWVQPIGGKPARRSVPSVADLNLQSSD